jgi:hypothetical protein
MLQDGQTFGDFEILSHIGPSDSERLYRARQVSQDRLVALKTLRGAASSDPEYRARFCRDVQAASALAHPDLVQIYAAGETDGVQWIATEFIEGTDALARLKRKGRLALPEAVAIGTHVADALHCAWSRAHLLHGDIRPGCILLSKKSEVKLSGLGLARITGGAKPFAADGSPAAAAHYMSPERAEGKADADIRADIYSLGCTLFHLISGEPPYGGDTALAVILHHVTQPVPELRAVCPQCPAAISRVVMKMMHKLPAGRHQNYAELIADLRLCYEALTNPVAAGKNPAAPPAPARERLRAPEPARRAAPAPVPVKVVAIPQPPVAAKPDAVKRDAVKVRPAFSEDADELEKSEVTGNRRSLKKPLAIAGGALVAVAVAVFCFSPWKKDGQLSEAQRAELDRADREAARKYDGSPPTPGATAKTPAVLPKKSATPAPATPSPAVAKAAPAKDGAEKIASATPEPPPPPPEKPTPAPAAPAAPQSPTAKWIAEQEPQWQAAFSSEVSEPFEKGVNDLKAQYLASVEREIAAASKTTEADAAVAFRAERARLAGGGTVPAEDESMAPASLRTMRANFRATFATLEKDRLARARTVHARTDAILAQAQAALAQRQRVDEAREIVARREALRTAWLPQSAASAATSEPGPTKTAPSPEAAPPPPKLPKLAPRDLVERLLAMGATVSVARPGGPKVVEKIADLPGDKFAISKVEFLPRDGLSAADLDIVEQLTDAEDLQLTGVPVTDATLKILRSLPSVRTLGLRDLQNLTAAGYRAVAAMPGLKTLNLRGPASTESLAAIAFNRKLDSLSISDVTFTEQDFAAIAAIPALRTLSITSRDPVVPAAWARLTAAKKLSTLTAEKTPVTSEIIAHIGKFSALTSLSLGDITVPDADLAPLGALKQLSTLRTTAGSTIDGGVFVAWPPHPAMKTLALGSSHSVSDKSLRAISAAFPSLTHLEVTAAAGSVTASGIVHLQKLRHLDYLMFTGDAVDPAALSHIAMFTQITHLGLGTPRLADTEVHQLAKITALHELEWGNPPSSPAALKDYAKLRGLVQFKVGTATKPDDLDKISAALPTVKVVP